MGYYRISVEVDSTGYATTRGSADTPRELEQEIRKAVRDIAYRLKKEGKL